MTKLINTEIYLKSIEPSHAEKHDYSKAVYVAAKAKIEIICKKHNTSFWQQAFTHKLGSGCPTCSDERRGGTQRTTQDDFIKSSREAQGSHIDHSLVQYKNSHTKVDFICTIDNHGVFSMLPLNRLRGQQCPKCANLIRKQKATKTQEKFLEECEALGHKNLTFESVTYSNDKKVVEITCKEHGAFYMTPGNFLQGQSCPKCAKNGYQPDKSGYLYVLSDRGTTEIGITNRNPTIRVKEVFRSGGPKMEVIATYYFKDGQLARNLEKACHTYLAANYKPVDATFDGSTECFLNVDIPALLNFISPLATEKPAATLESE